MGMETQRATSGERSGLFARWRDIRSENGERDERHRHVVAARRGDVHALLPGLFPDKWPKQATANVVDTAATDTGEMLAPLPSINCRPRAASAAAQKRASLKNRIARSYIEAAHLESHMASFGDRFASFGFGAFCVDPDFEADAPFMRVNDFPVSTYYTLDLRGRTVEYFKAWREHAAGLAAKFPAFEQQIMITDAFGHKVGGNAEVEVVKAYVWGDMPTLARDADGEVMFDDNDEPVMDYERAPRCVLFCPDRDDVVLSESWYPKMSRIPVVVAERPKWDEEVRGQFDSAVWVQTLRARMELFTMQAADESINAPIQVPSDVMKIPTGPRALFRSNSDRPAHRLDLNIPNGVFAQNERMSREERTAARYPEGRSGNIDASVITGQGVQELLGTMDTQLKSYQQVIKRAYEEALSIAFEMDAKYFGGEKKSIEGTLDGELFHDTYDPAEAIGDDWRVDVTYGFAAGLDPNRALVFLLQLRGDRLIDRDTVMRQMPFELDVNAISQRIDTEEITDALKQAMFGLAAQIGQPEFAGMGIDPRQVLRQVSDVISAREKGTPLHDAMSKAFEPTEEEQRAQQQAEQQQMSALDQLGAAGGGAGGGIPSGGMGSPQAGSMDDVQQLVAGMRQSGRPQVSANVSRMRSA